VSLHVEASGEGPTLVMAHGFTQTGRLWGEFGELLGRGRRLLAVDLPGHGGSSGVPAGLEDGGRMLLAAGGEPPFDVLGYSLGARFALHSALASAESVARLVLIGGTAGIENDEARAERRRRDEEMAASLEAQENVDAFIEGWLHNPMFVTLRAEAAGTSERRRNTPAGLASSLRLAGAGVQAPLWDRLGELTMPVLVIAGATDVRYQALGVRLAGTVAHGNLAVIPGAGHAAHLEQPRLTAAVVDAWLAATASSD